MSDKKDNGHGYYKFGKFKDGWWSVINWNHDLKTVRWGKWRGPFDTKIEAQIDCANHTQGRYQL